MKGGRKISKDPEGEWVWPQGQQCPGPEVRACLESSRGGDGVGAGAGGVALGFVQRSQSTWGLVGHDEQFGSYRVYRKATSYLT